jgi:putative hydrolase of the HAD superfamily
MIMNIIFDIDDTLFPSSDFSALARRNAINAMIDIGLDCSYEELNDKLNSIIKTKGSNYGRHFDDLCLALGITDSSRFVAAAIAAYHDTKTSIAPFPKVALTLLKLKENGHRLYVATNGASVKQWDKLIRLGLELYFDEVFVSEALGMEKCKQFYERVISTLGCGARDCLMVGDREVSDIVPAKEAGMLTVRVLQGKHRHEPSTADFTVDETGDVLALVQRL